MTRLYIAAAALLVWAATVAGLFYYRGNAIKAEAELGTTKQALSDTRAAFDRVSALRAAEDKLLGDIRGQLQTLNQMANVTRTQVNELVTSNEDVRAYLSGQLPSELKRLLNGADAGKGGSAATTGRAAK